MSSLSPPTRVCKNIQSPYGCRPTGRDSMPLYGEGTRVFPQLPWGMQLYFLREILPPQWQWAGWPAGWSCLTGSATVNQPLGFHLARPWQTGSGLPGPGGKVRAIWPQTDSSDTMQRWGTLVVPCHGMTRGGQVSLLNHRCCSIEPSKSLAGSGSRWRWPWLWAHSLYGSTPSSF